MELTIREARSDDAKAISQVIVATVRESNGQDYPASIIESVAANFAPERVIELLEKRLVFVALLSDKIVGTGALDGNAVRSLFIAPLQQRKGIGQALMSRIEKTALQRSVEALLVPASLTAEGFYSRLGYRVIREQLQGEERTLIMTKPLAPL
ncbi:GNAT family N-acetyltransferase [Pseudomonas sp. GD04087]|uniref:GNAT family N-acetyltransferase n=1 Tax=unclassified Pseudomonas TaxID=196821 RepID=UPI002446939D|nr:MULTISPECIES: GNAT family N-acetyltransferase [unclassified Pseudomonas]MDH0292419.1 GNAT family N-acetyltransferase [Pseudomonas sp. GD04087]MDH1049393.1 GNAT family N-acetyltransferase [Pseudomonas sp. GD03903]MDH2002536.1 GNAT family N-acetyltransferase [Pseudomonas sp. GD03691]